MAWSVYRSRPIDVKAIQWCGTKDTQLIKYQIGDEFFRELSPYTAEVFDALRNSWIKLHNNDWVVLGIKGEAYSCNNTVFRLKYEALKETDKEQSLESLEEGLGLS